MSHEPLEIISNKEAIKKGLKFYFTGKPCKRGHLSKRWIKSHGCVICSHRHREWVANNRDKVNKWRREVWKRSFSYQKRRISFQILKQSGFEFDKSLPRWVRWKLAYEILLQSGFNFEELRNEHAKTNSNASNSSEL